ncbi:MAG: thioredoxin-related protein [Planctomycetota bacterium]
MLRASALVVVLLVSTTSACRTNIRATESTTPISSSSSQSGAGIEFTDDLDQAKRSAVLSNKPVALIFGAIWCGSCKAFRANTIGSASIREYSDKFEWVFINIDRNASLARQFKVSSTPQMFVLDPLGQILAQAIGNLAPPKFSAFLDSTLDLYTASNLQPVDDPIELWSALDHTELTWTPNGYRANSICYSHVGYGPFNVPSQSPIAFLRLSPRPRTPSTLTQGQTEVRWNENITNFWAFKEGEYLLDYGALTSSVAYAYGLSDTVQVEFELTDFRRFDSALDDITDAFHGLFGLDDSGRDAFPKNQNVVQFGGIDSRDESTYSDDFAVTVQHNLTCGTEELPAFSYALTARTNAGGNSPGNRGSNLSLGLSTAASRRLGEEAYIYGGLSYVWHGRDEVRSLPLESTQISALLAGEWRYRARAAWIMQYLWTEAVSETFAPFDKATHEFNIGWKTEFENNFVFEISLIENAIVVDNSPDFGVHLGLSKRF